MACNRVTMVCDGIELETSMSIDLKPSRDAVLLERILNPDQPLLSTTAAQAILALELPASEKKRLRELADKSRNGTLTTEEQEEIDAYLRVGSLVSILKSKARRTLAK
jgi:hypothetical protein